MIFTRPPNRPPFPFFLLLIKTRITPSEMPLNFNVAEIESPNLEIDSLASVTSLELLS